MINMNKKKIGLILIIILVLGIGLFLVLRPNDNKKANDLKISYSDGVIKFNDFSKDFKIEKTITVNNLTTANIDGNTYYYFTDNDGQKYKVSIKVDKNNLPFIKNGDAFKIKYTSEGTVISIVEIIALD